MDEGASAIMLSRGIEACPWCSNTEDLSGLLRPANLLAQPQALVFPRDEAGHTSLGSPAVRSPLHCAARAHASEGREESRCEPCSSRTVKTGAAHPH